MAQLTNSPDAAFLGSGAGTAVTQETRVPQVADYDNGGWKDAPVLSVLDVPLLDDVEPEREPEPDEPTQPMAPDEPDPDEPVSEPVPQTAPEPDPATSPTAQDPEPVPYFGTWPEPLL